MAEMDAKAGDMDTDVGCMYGAYTDCDFDMTAADLNRPEPGVPGPTPDFDTPLLLALPRQGSARLVHAARRGRGSPPFGPRSWRLCVQQVGAPSRGVPSRPTWAR